MTGKLPTISRGNTVFFRMQILASLVLAVSADIRNPGLIEPSRCETCKYFTLELSQRLLETGSKKEILQTGHGLDRKKKEIKVAKRRHFQNLDFFSNYSFYKSIIFAPSTFFLTFFLSAWNRPTANYID